MSNEIIKTKPPTCRELQTQITMLRALVQEQDANFRVKLEQQRERTEELRQECAAQWEMHKVLDTYARSLDAKKLDAEASRMITADIQTALSNATKYYEQAHAIFNDTLAASKTVAKTAQSLTNFERVLANYYRLPWYKRIFRAPKPPRTTEEKK